MTSRVFAKPSLIRTLGLVALGIAVMFGVDVVLAKVERQESGVEAQRRYRNAQRLVAQDRRAEAVEQLRAALAEERNNSDFRLALGEAQFSAGELGDAASTLSDLLQADPFSGAGNLAMARVRLKQGDRAAAISLYHRAIYGRWSQNAAGRRVQARFELVNLLDRSGLKQDLLAELLPLQEEAPSDLATRERIGFLFLDAGSAVRAADVFRAIARDDPKDAAAHAGLGEAEFAGSNYVTAEMEFRQSLALRPDDAATRAKLILCEQVLAWNPTRRGLTPEEQDQRSRKLVEAVLNDVKQCAGSSSTPLLQSVEQGLKKRTAIAQNLDWADQLWAIRKTQCGPALSATEQPLGLVLGVLAR